MLSGERFSGARLVPLATGCVSTLAWGLLAGRAVPGLPPLGLALAAMGLAWLALGLALRTAATAPGPLILGFAAVFRVIAVSAEPVMADDHWRFLWDGYRFAATGNPYAEPPLARFGDDTVPVEFRAVLDRINHPEVPTVYGPVTQWAFRLAHALAPAQLWPWKLILLASELALFALLWPRLDGRGRLLLAWCPLAVFETGFNAHPDVLALVPAVAAWRLAAGGRTAAAGAFMGAAVATKLFAVLLAPFVLWRLGWRAWAVAAAAGLACYAPFWASGSTADLAGLRAMAGEWEFNSSGFALAAAVASPDLARSVCAVLFAALWAGLFWRSRQSPPSVLPPGEWIFGGFLLLSAVANPWYFLWLWPFVAARPAATGCAALAAASLAHVTGLNLGDPELGNFGHPAWLRPLEFGLVLLAATWDWHRRRHAGNAGPRCGAGPSAPRIAPPPRAA